MKPLLYQLGVKAIILNKNQDVLLLRRDNIHAPEGFYWDLPGGLVEEGEEPLLALSREIYEETGIKSVKIGEFIHAVITDHNINRGKAHRILMIYLCTVPHLPVIKLSDEHSAYAWMHYQNAAQQLIKRYKLDLTVKLEAYIKVSSNIVH